MSDDPLAAPDEGGAPRGPTDRSLDGLPAEADERLEALRAEAAARAREAAEVQDRYLRTLADFDNYRRRMTREREDWRRQAQEELLREILPALDNFDRALAAEPAPTGASGFRAGVELIHRDFLKALERLGVRSFTALGEPFDPQRHEAVARVERADVTGQTVVAETQRGYLIQERVLRPAQVVVAVPAPAGSDPGEV